MFGTPKTNMSPFTLKIQPEEANVFTFPIDFNQVNRHFRYIHDHLYSLKINKREPIRVDRYQSNISISSDTASERPTDEDSAEEK